MSLAFEIDSNNVSFVAIGKPRKAFVYENGERTEQRVKNANGVSVARMDIALALNAEPQGRATLQAPDDLLDKLGFGTAYRPKGQVQIGVSPRDQFSVNVVLRADAVEELFVAE